LGDMMTLLKLRRGEYSLVEEKIAEGATVIGKAIKDLSLPENCVIAGIIRRGKVVIPKGNTIFEINDEVLAITDRAGAEQLSNLLSPKWG
jgi:trk system potassium uptake protein